MSVSGLDGARRLARVLLADPLAEEAEWEKQLVDTNHDERAILLRYITPFQRRRRVTDDPSSHGETSDLYQPHALLRTMIIPAAILESQRLEILIHVAAPNSNNVSVEVRLL